MDSPDGILVIKDLFPTVEEGGGSTLISAFVYILLDLLYKILANAQTHKVPLVAVVPTYIPLSQPEVGSETQKCID